MKYKWLIFILGLIISQYLFCQESSELDKNNKLEENDWVVHFWFGPSCSLGFFDYLSFQYGLGSFLSFQEILPAGSEKHEKSIGMNNYILYEHKDNYSKIRFNTNLSIFTKIVFWGCSLLLNFSENNHIWGFSPEIGLRSPFGLLDIFYRYNIYQNNILNCHEFGVRVSLYLFVLTNDK